MQHTLLTSTKVFAGDLVQTTNSVVSVSNKASWYN